MPHQRSGEQLASGTTLELVLDLGLAPVQDP